MTRSIKTVLVSTNNKKAFESTMAMATKISEAYDSHIIGLYVVPSAIVLSPPYGFGGPINMAELNEFYREQAIEVEDMFKAYAAKENLNSEWRTVHSNGLAVTDTVIEHGREADLIIVGDDRDTRIDLHFEGRIVQEAGRPVLFVPSNLRKPVKLDTAMIGWDGSREAARAAFDGIPLLKMCGEARVTCVNAHKERAISGETPGSELANALARHDVRTTAVSLRSKKKVGKALLAEAAKADLLVMGAYGHSRLTEDIFGGVTNKALTAAPCPVLMSN